MNDLLSILLNQLLSSRVSGYDIANSEQLPPDMGTGINMYGRPPSSIKSLWGYPPAPQDLPQPMDIQMQDQREMQRRQKRINAEKKFIV